MWELVVGGDVGETPHSLRDKANEGNVQRPTKPLFLGFGCDGLAVFPGEQGEVPAFVLREIQGS